MQLNPKLKFSSQIYTLNASRKALGFRGIPGLLNSNPITVADEQDGQGNYIYPRDLIEGDFKNIGVENRLLARYDIGFLKSKKAHHFLIGMKYYRARNAALQGPASRGSDAD